MEDSDPDDPDSLSLYSPLETITIEDSSDSDHTSRPMLFEDEVDLTNISSQSNHLVSETQEKGPSVPGRFNKTADNLPSASPLQYFQMENGLRSIKEIPERYRSVFSEYPCFNRIQSRIMDVVFYSDEPLVVTAPTGSGKTVIFELAIIRLLMAFEHQNPLDFKIIYMAPVKALCTEKLHEWARKFSRLKVNCLEVTGDSDIPDLNYLNKHHLILTTPEKWDSLTRRWRDNINLMQTVKLFLIDEVHILNEESRGPTLEAVVSRMKMLKQQQLRDSQLLPTLRFVAVSATIPNIEDLSEWLGSVEHPAKFFKIEEDLRPVKLQKVVKGYDSNLGGYQFDIHLSYKLKTIIAQYSSGKPTLVFCNTRKSVTATANVLSKMVTFNFSAIEKAHMMNLSQQIIENAVKDLFVAGIGCHHAGLVLSDRNLIEDTFRSGALPVLIATSTLAMGVNLPAHLVVIKTTQFYGNGGYQDYSDSQVLQMMGRAGRPQYDTSAVVVIMTKSSCAERFSRLVAGRDPIQSSLHRHLAEHLNAEVVLSTVRDLPGAVDWMRSTFLFVRALRSPQQYGLAPDCDPDKAKINTKLQELVKVELNGLARYKLVETNGVDVRETPAGRLMARFYIAFDTMKIFQQMTGEEGLSELLGLLSQAAEFQDVQLRNDEKRGLNALNSSKQGGPGLRFPIKGRIKARENKVNCLLQAVLGGLTIHEPSLQQEASRVVRVAERLARCLYELVRLQSWYSALLAAVLLSKCVRCRLWEDSPLAGRQLPRIGPVLGQLLVAAGKTSLKAIAQSNPRDLERILNRLPPFGNELREAAEAVPSYSLNLAVQSQGTVDLTVSMENPDLVAYDPKHWLDLLVGDNNNNKVLCHERVSCAKLMQGIYTRRIDVSEPSLGRITAHLISEMWVGMDAETVLVVKAPPNIPGQLRGKTKATSKRPSFMDQLKEMGSRMNDTPSLRAPCNKGIVGNVSERLQSFKKTEAKLLPKSGESLSELEDPLGDWDVQEVTPSSKAAGSAGSPRRTWTSSWDAQDTPSTQNARSSDKERTCLDDQTYHESGKFLEFLEDPFDDDWLRHQDSLRTEASTQASSSGAIPSTPSASKRVGSSSRTGTQSTIRDYFPPLAKGSGAGVCGGSALAEPAPGARWQVDCAEPDEDLMEDPFAMVDWEEPSDLARASAARASRCVPNVSEGWTSAARRRDGCENCSSPLHIGNITFDIGIEELLQSYYEDDHLCPDTKIDLEVENVNSHLWEQEMFDPSMPSSWAKVRTPDLLEGLSSTFHAEQGNSPSRSSALQEYRPGNKLAPSCVKLDAEFATVENQSCPEEVAHSIESRGGQFGPVGQLSSDSPPAFVELSSETQSTGALSNIARKSDVNGELSSNAPSCGSSAREALQFIDSISLEVGNIYHSSEEEAKLLPPNMSLLKNDHLDNCPIKSHKQKDIVMCVENTIPVASPELPIGSYHKAERIFTDKNCPSRSNDSDEHNLAQTPCVETIVAKGLHPDQQSLPQVLSAETVVADGLHPDPYSVSRASSAETIIADGLHPDQQSLSRVSSAETIVADGLNPDQQSLSRAPSAQTIVADGLHPDQQSLPQVPSDETIVERLPSFQSNGENPAAVAAAAVELNVPWPAPEVRQAFDVEPASQMGSVNDSKTSMADKVSAGESCHAVQQEIQTQEIIISTGDEGQVTCANHPDGVTTSTIQLTEQPCPPPHVHDALIHMSNDSNIPATAHHVKHVFGFVEPAKFVLASSPVAVHTDQRKPLQFGTGALRSESPVSKDILNILKDVSPGNTPTSGHASGAVFGRICRRSGAEDSSDKVPAMPGIETPPVNRKPDFIEKILAEKYLKKPLPEVLDESTGAKSRPSKPKVIRTLNTDGILVSKTDTSSDRKPDFLDRLLKEPLRRLTSKSTGVTGIMVSTKRKAASSSNDPQQLEALLRFERNPEEKPSKRHKKSPVSSERENTPKFAEDMLSQRDTPLAVTTPAVKRASVSAQDTTKSLWGQRGITVTRSGRELSEHPLKSLMGNQETSKAEGAVNLNDSPMKKLVSLSATQGTTKSLWGQRSATATRSRHQLQGAEQPIGQLFQKILSGGGACSSLSERLADITESDRKENSNIAKYSQWSSKRHEVRHEQTSRSQRTQEPLEKIKPTSSKSFMDAKFSLEGQSANYMSPNKSPSSFLKEDFHLEGVQSPKKRTQEWKPFKSENLSNDIFAHGPHIYQTPKAQVSGYTLCSPTPVSSSSYQESTPVCLPKSMYYSIPPGSLDSPQETEKYPRSPPQFYSTGMSGIGSLSYEEREEADWEYMDNEEFRNWRPSGNEDISFSPVTVKSPSATFQWRPSSVQELSFDENFMGRREFPLNVSPQDPRHRVATTLARVSDSPDKKPRSGLISKKLVLALSPSRKTTAFHCLSKWDSFLGDDLGSPCLPDVVQSGVPSQQSPTL